MSEMHDQAQERAWDQAGHQVDEWVARFRAQRAARQVDADLQHGRGAFHTGGIIPRNAVRPLTTPEIEAWSPLTVARPRLRSCTLCGGLGPGCSTCNPHYAE